MAFGDYATLLSSFTGADEDPLSEGGNWTTLNAWPGSFSSNVHGRLRRESNKLGVFQSYTGSLGPNHVLIGQAYWSFPMTSPDQEIYYTIKTPQTHFSTQVFLRLKPSDSTAIIAAVQDGPVADWSIGAAVDDSQTIVWADSDVNVVPLGDGYRYGWRIECDTLTLFVDSGSGFEEIISRDMSVEYEHLTAGDDTAPEFNYQDNTYVGIGLNWRVNSVPINFPGAFDPGTYIDDVYAGSIPVDPTLSTIAPVLETPTFDGSQICFDWNDIVGCHVLYEVWASYDDADFVKIADGLTVSEYCDGSFSWTRKACYKVRAYNGYQTGPFSNIQCIDFHQLVSFHRDHKFKGLKIS